MRIEGGPSEYREAAMVRWMALIVIGAVAVAWMVRDTVQVLLKVGKER